LATVDAQIKLLEIMKSDIEEMIEPEESAVLPTAS
jgi:hypothetical protein